MGREMGIKKKIFEETNNKSKKLNIFKTIIKIKRFTITFLIIMVLFFNCHTIYSQKKEINNIDTFCINSRQFELNPKDCEILKKIVLNSDNGIDSIYNTYFKLASFFAATELHLEGKELWLLEFGYGATYDEKLIFKQTDDNRFEKLHRFTSIQMTPIKNSIHNIAKDIKVIDRYAAPHGYRDFEYILRFNGQNYDTAYIYGIKKELYSKLEIDYILTDSIIETGIDFGYEFRVVSKYTYYRRTDENEEKLFYLFLRENKDEGYFFAGTFPAFPKIHIHDVLDTYNKMPVFETKSFEPFEYQRRLHYFNGERYIGVIRFNTIKDEKEVYKDRIRFSNRLGFEIILEK